MARRVTKDEYRIPGDLPGTRGVLLQVATKFNIYFMCAMALGGGALFLAGVFGVGSGGAAGEQEFENIPEPILLKAIGMVCFSLFFPFFLALYFGRHFLRSMVRLEDEVARLKAVIEDELEP